MKIIIKKKAIEKIKTGQAVVTEKNTRIKLANAQYDFHPIGLAARDIEKGEIIEYSPLESTKDIIIFSSGLICVIRKHEPK